MTFLGGKEPIRDLHQLKSSTNSNYFPLRYANQTKTPAGKFVRYAWLTDDLYVLLIAFAGSVTTWTDLPGYFLAIVFSSLAIWVVYELGYYDNDRCGYLYEEDPKVPENFADFLNWRSSPKAILLALLSSIAAAFAATTYLDRSFGISLSILAAGLLTIISVFAIFNRLPKPWRPIPHLCLQALKYLTPIAVASLSAIGWCLIIAQVVFRTLPYQRYRWFDQEFNHDCRLEQLAVFLSGVALVVVLSGFDLGLMQVTQAAIGAGLIVRRFN